MVIEGRFMRNLRKLLVLVIFLGTAQYLVGSFVFQSGRERAGDHSIRNFEEQPALKNNMTEISKGQTVENSFDSVSSVIEMEGANDSRNFSFDQWDRIAQSVQFMNTNTTTFCEAMPPGLGPFQVNVSAVSLRDVEDKYPEVQLGGYYKPNCTAIHKVAIIVPYRDRIDQLAIFLNNIHPFLMRQQIEYQIFIVEQRDSSPFNRGKLFNIGFVESQKFGYHCFVFHDVDLLPLDTRNLYSCPRQPRHKAPTNASNQNVVKLVGPKDDDEPEFVGVMTAMTEEQFRKVNGFSNKYKNLGGEDEDMTIRLWIRQLQVEKYDPSVSRYLKLNHTKFGPDPKRNFTRMPMGADRGIWTDGLNTLQYKILSTNENHLYTHLVAWIEYPTIRDLIDKREPPLHALGG